MNMLKENINEVIKSLKEAEDFITTRVGKPDEDTGAIEWDVKYTPNLNSLYDDINDVVGKLSKLKGKL